MSLLGRAGPARWGPLQLSTCRLTNVTRRRRRRRSGPMAARYFFIRSSWSFLYKKRRIDVCLYIYIVCTMITYCIYMIAEMGLFGLVVVVDHDRDARGAGRSAADRISRLVRPSAWWWWWRLRNLFPPLNRRRRLSRLIYSSVKRNNLLIQPVDI